MRAMIIKIQTIEEKNVCDVCGWSWKQRSDTPPKVCPECKRKDWNKTGIMQDLTIPIEEIKLECEDINTLNRFEHDYGMPLEHYLRYNK